MKKNSDNSIQFLEVNLSAGQISEYQPILYGDNIEIAIPGTSLLAKSQGNNLNWKSSSGLFDKKDMVFRIMPVEKQKKIGEKVRYGDRIGITYGDVFVVVLNKKYGFLEIKYGNFEDIIKNSEYIATFSLVSKMVGYYCDNKTIKPVDIKNVDDNGFYKGKKVYRNSECFGICEYNNTLTLTKNKKNKSNKNNNNILLFVGILSMILIILSIIYFIKK